MLLAIVSLNVRSTNPIESRFKKFAAYIVIKTNFDLRDDISSCYHMYSNGFFYWSTIDIDRLAREPFASNFEKSSSSSRCKDMCMY